MLPLVTRFPALAAVPRAVLGAFPSPVEQVELAEGTLWIKRDDLDAPILGGNKVRALEFLLGRVRPGDTVLTVGGEGSTHVLATAVHARRLGARTVAVRWRHDMNPVAHVVAARAADACDSVDRASHAVTGMLRAALRRATLHRTARRVHYVPLGGSTPLGILGHVNAALELAEQVRRGKLPAPRRVVVALGSGGTAAGLALGLAIAGLDATVVGARVGPRLLVTRRRVLALARATRRLIARHADEPVPGRDVWVEVVHDVYGGGYGRPLARGDAAAQRLRAHAGIRLDATYAAKALAAALDVAGRHAGPTLFWQTFDGRWIDTSVRER